MWEEYLFANSVEHALELLARYEGQAQLIAGGTDLVLQSQRGQCPATVMVDITRIPGLNRIEERDGFILIGAQVTHAQIAASALIRDKAPILAMACSQVGGPQTRNAGTLVGNVVNAQPAADGATALFVLDAELEVATQEGRRWEPIAHVYRGVGICTINACREMVTAVRFKPLANACGCSYQRLARRKALTLPTLVVAVALEMLGDTIKAARIAIGPVAPTPYRATDAEAYLVGKKAEEAVFAEAGQLAAAKARPRDSLIRGSSEYRTAMVGVLVRRALGEAAQECHRRG
ncbi:MAG: xanthine dehydrogenase family protein subunit M [Anaerolineae bacterium]|nr:xanthine dehydrogenase family protein subunit M [Anaerolineae bacterium]